MFQPNVNQLAFDFDNEPETAPQAQKTVEAKQIIPETPKPDTAAETAVPEDSADVDTPDFRFTPTVSPDGKTFDFTGVPANKIYLVSQKNILSKERPSWMPEWDINFMNKSAFIPPFLNRGGHFEIVTEKANYLLTPEVFTASIDYYMKYKKQLNQDRANAVNQEFFDKAKDMFISKFYRENKEADNLQKYAVSDFDISWDKKKVGSRNDQLHSLDVTVKTKDGAYSKVVSVFPSSFNTRIYESKFDLGNLYQNIFYPIKAERVNLISKTSMTHKQAALYKSSGLSTKEMWKQWEGDRELIDQKLLDMQGHLDDYRSVYIKGKETSYGDANLNDSLLEKYGVMVKRQNGDPIDKEEISQIETAIQTVTKVFGNVRDISREYGLKISHSSDKLMHASKYTGIFTPYYKSLGVSFKQEDIAPFIMAHEYAHFLDAFAGKEEKHFFFQAILKARRNITPRVFSAI